MRRELIGRAAVAAAVALLACGAAGSAAAKERFRANLRLSSQRPNAPTGGSLHLIWPNNGPGGKPKPEATGIFRLPAGTRVDESAVPECTASDAELQALGGAACPASSYLGPGHASVITGFGPPLDPLLLDDRWYHGPHEIIGIFTDRGTTAPVVKVNKVEIHGATFIARLSLPPGYPPGTKTAPKTTDQIIQMRTGPHGSFITTPPRCPPSRVWISHAKSIYDDGSSDSATTAMPCRRPPPRWRPTGPA